MYMYPVQTWENVFLHGHLYSARNGSPKTISVLARCSSSDPQSLRYPCIESVFDDPILQSHIHDIYIHIVHIRSIRFRVFLKRHMLLPYNPYLGIQGDALVMRVAAHNKDSVVNLRPSDNRLMDSILHK
jgi:hypothetical protein